MLAATNKSARQEAETVFCFFNRGHEQQHVGSPRLSSHTFARSRPGQDRCETEEVSQRSQALTDLFPGETKRQYNIYSCHQLFLPKGQTVWSFPPGLTLSTTLSFRQARVLSPPPHHSPTHSHTNPSLNQTRKHQQAPFRSHLPQNGGSRWRS